MNQYILQYKAVIREYVYTRGRWKIRPEWLHFLVTKKYDRYVWTKDDPGKSDIDMWRTVIFNGLSPSVSMKLPLVTWHTSGHDRKLCSYDSYYDYIFEHQNNITCITNQKTYRLLVICSSILAYDYIDPLTQWTQIPTASLSTSRHVIFWGGANDRYQEWNPPNVSCVKYLLPTQLLYAMEFSLYGRRANGGRGP